jgi:hypothetical protein
MRRAAEGHVTLHLRRPSKVCLTKTCICRAMAELQSNSISSRELDCLLKGTFVIIVEECMRSSLSRTHSISVGAMV